MQYTSWTGVVKRQNVGIPVCVGIGPTQKHEKSTVQQPDLLSGQNSYARMKDGLDPVPANVNQWDSAGYNWGDG
ncbi:hypothetical protein NB640_01470 [Oxalobacter vibrioformis]|uniref:Uncharacterized protein n=1 Tax=Oxalobacter vibrioformis TaxID=933080 RepID=A0A9E9P3S9_9BURK|nr:hypothetical protein [Oxalobacter vibrioformis]WAW10363.1 hypothetical protein NB640_01470 [Oxalobacter vibrioformis]